MTALLIVTLGLWGAGWLLPGRMKKCGNVPAPGAAAEAGRGARPATPGAGMLPISADRLSIIIPARNEERNLPTLLRSIATQPVKPHEIIVVNDSSTDRTAEMAQQLGARVVNSRPLLDGWRGKTWACHQGAQTATGELLLFLDADTWFEPDGLARVLVEYAASPSSGSSRRESALTPRPSQAERTDARCYKPFGLNGGALSVGPFHAVRRAYEDLSLFFNYNMTVGTVPQGLFGQMLLVDRESYRRVGGHEAVKGRILENCFLAQLFRDAGIPVRSATGRGVLSFRMYPGGVRELIEGWTKGFAAGAGQTPRSVLLLVIAWMAGLMFAPLGWAMTGNWVCWGATYLLCALQVGWLARRIGAFRWWTALLYPVPLVFFFVVFARSATRGGKQVTWKGRTLHAD
jgi:4,4'-diaponeurosporenoate glycosyltransferase